MTMRSMLEILVIVDASVSSAEWEWLLAIYFTFAINEFLFDHTWQDTAQTNTVKIVLGKKSSSVGLRPATPSPSSLKLEHQVTILAYVCASETRTIHSVACTSFHHATLEVWSSMVGSYSEVSRYNGRVGRG
jgi:hypothetical protein